MKHAQIPTFQVEKLERAQEFYTGVMGFTNDWVWQHDPDFPRFASFTRGAHTLYLTEHEECRAGGLVYLYLQNEEALQRWCDFIHVQGGHFDYGPIKQPWNLIEAQITDPFTNKLRLCTELSEK